MGASGLRVERAHIIATEIESSLINKGITEISNEELADVALNYLEKFKNNKEATS